MEKVFHILQLRHHPSIIELKNRVVLAPQNQKFDVDLTYITGRGKWYFYSWKSEIEKSGGITTNIGSHFFDMLIHLFGNVQDIIVHTSTPTVASGYLELQRARVRWFLSLDMNHVPQLLRDEGKTTFRSLRIDNEEFEFSDGFTDLHTLSYEKILQGEGFTLKDAYPYISLCQKIRDSKLTPQFGEHHPFYKNL